MSQVLKNDLNSLTRDCIQQSIPIRNAFTFDNVFAINPLILPINRNKSNESIHIFNFSMTR